MKTRIKERGKRGVPMKTVLTATSIVVALAAPAPVRAQAQDFSLNFQTENQSMFGSGDERTFSFRDSLAVPWSGSASVGGTPSRKIFGTRFYGLGVWASAETYGRAALDLAADFRGGGIDAFVPVAGSLEVLGTGTLLPGQTFTVSTRGGADLDRAGFNTHSAEGSASLTARVDAHASMDVAGSAGKKWAKHIPILDIHESHKLVEVSTHDAYTTNSPWGGVRAGFPRVETTSVRSGDRLTSSGRDDFLSGRVNVSRVIQDYTGIPLSGSVGFGPVQAGWNALDLTLGASVGAAQYFSLVTTPMVTLTALGQDYRRDYTFRLGESVDVLLPEELTGLTLEPTFWLDAQFSNRTAMKLTGTADLHYLSVYAKAFGMRRDLEPIRPYHGQWTYEKDVWTKQFALTGFNTQKGNTFAVTAIPEPPTGALLAAGAFVAFARARRRSRSRTA